MAAVATSEVEMNFPSNNQYVSRASLSTNKTEGAVAGRRNQGFEFTNLEEIVVKNPELESTAKTIRWMYYGCQAAFLVSALPLQIVAKEQLGQSIWEDFGSPLFWFLLFSAIGNVLIVTVRNDPGFLTTQRFDPAHLNENKGPDQGQRASQNDRKLSKSDPTIAHLQVMKYFEDRLQEAEMVRYPASHRECNTLMERLVQSEAADEHYAPKRGKATAPIELVVIRDQKEDQLVVPAQRHHIKRAVADHLTPIKTHQAEQTSVLSPSEAETPKFLLQTRLISFGGDPSVAIDDKPKLSVVKVPSGSSSKGSSLRCKSGKLDKYISRDFKSKEKKERREKKPSWHLPQDNFTFNEGGRLSNSFTSRSKGSEVVGNKKSNRLQLGTSPSRIRQNSVQIGSEGRSTSQKKFGPHPRLSEASKTLTGRKMSEQVGPTISEEDSSSDDKFKKSSQEDVGKRLQTEADVDSQEDSDKDSQSSGSSSSRNSSDSVQTQRGDYEFEDLGESKQIYMSDFGSARPGRAELPTSVEDQYGSSARNTFLRHNEELAENPPTLTVPCLVAIRSTPVQHTCKICHILQPFRARHCRSCGACIAKFDHHCYYLGMVLD